MQTPFPDTRHIRPRIIKSISRICELMGSVANHGCALPITENFDKVSPSAYEVCIERAEDLKKTLVDIKKACDDALLFTNSYMQEVKSKKVKES
jgi:hypothetical protein